MKSKTDDSIIELSGQKVENSLNYDLLSEEEKNQVASISNSIDISSSNAVIKYGASVQNKMAEFSDIALKNVKTSKAGEVGDVLSSLVAQINDFDAASYNNNKITRFFAKSKNTVEKMMAKYGQVETNVDKIILQLEKNKIQLMKDIALYDNMYNENLIFFKQISLYIIAGEQKIKDIKENELPRLKKTAEETKEQINIHAVNDLSDLCNKLEKKMLDLKMTRIISIQMAPQIRMLQSNESELTEKIQSTIVNTIPLWKSQLLLALGVANAKTAYQVQNAVSNATNDLLRKNSELLKQGSIEIAKESERSIIDVETLRQTNANIIQTLDEILSIHKEGSKLRLAAEQELLEIENEMKEKLNELRA